MNIMIIVEGQANLFEVAAALRSASRFTGLLYCGKQQRNKDGDARNHHGVF